MISEAQARVLEVASKGHFWPRGHEWRSVTNLFRSNFIERAAGDLFRITDKGRAALAEYRKGEKG